MKVSDELIVGQLRTDQVLAVTDLLKEYFAWALSLDPASDAAPTFQHFEEELRDLPGIFGPPSGRLLVAELKGNVCGTVALRRLDGRTCELKRLYVLPEARGHNVGGALVDRLLAEARSIGYRRMILDSHYTMKSAHAVYRTAGFRDALPPEGFPQELIPLVVFMERDL